MKLSRHPENQYYLNNLASYYRCQNSIADWKSNSDLIVVKEYCQTWNYADFQRLVENIAQMMVEYNKILWAEFPYCRICNGGCCLVNAAQVSHFDLLALAVLEHQLPALNGDIWVTERNCIYLGSEGCSWPANWRTLKCWLFYCLGAEVLNMAESPDSKYEEVTSRLSKAVNQFLPQSLLTYQSISGLQLTDYLVDPLCFFEELDRAINKVIVFPLDKKFPFIKDLHPHHLGNERGLKTKDDSMNLPLDDDIFPYITNAIDYLHELSLSNPAQSQGIIDQMLTDLENLEWILLENPQNSLERIADIQTHFNQPIQFQDQNLSSLASQMYRHLQQTIDNWIR